jgi:hypothetical protein
MKFLLVVLFNFGGPTYQFADGFLPLQFDTMAECEQRRIMMDEYLKQDNAPPYQLACYAPVPKGEPA